MIYDLNIVNLSENMTETLIGIKRLSSEIYPETNNKRHCLELPIIGIKRSRSEIYIIEENNTHKRPRLSTYDRNCSETPVIGSRRSRPEDD